MKKIVLNSLPLITLLVLVLGMSCKTESTEQSTPKTQTKTTQKSESVYPIQIGNEHGNLVVKRIEKSTPNKFLITLEGFPEYNFSKEIDKYDLYKSAGIDMKNDSVKNIIQNSKLTGLALYFVRSSTLQMKAHFVNEKRSQSYNPLISVFYRGKKKGIIY